MKVADADPLRQALVLLADHEFNPSTFAVRVCASTGGTLAAALIAGLATLSGPRHGGAASNARRALEASLEGSASRTSFLATNATMTPYDFGFGHPLYPDGDPRAAMLLDALGSQPKVQRAVSQMAKLVGVSPNIDMALAALVKALKLPDDAAMAIFAASRFVGWVAHAIEQVESRQLIRPRANFTPVNGRDHK